MLNSEIYFWISIIYCSDQLAAVPRGGGSDPPRNGRTRLGSAVPKGSPGEGPEAAVGQNINRNRENRRCRFTFQIEPKNGRIRSDSAVPRPAFGAPFQAPGSLLSSPRASCRSSFQIGPKNGRTRSDSAVPWPCPKRRLPFRGPVQIAAWRQLPFRGPGHIASCRSVALSLAIISPAVVPWPCGPTGLYGGPMGPCNDPVGAL